MATLEQVPELRRRLYTCTELRAEAISAGTRRDWLVDVFAEEDDPVLEMIDKITWSEAGATAMGLAGGSGVGKTTQIYRLIHELKRRHGIVGIRVGYEDYSSLSSPPDITDFLLSVVGGLGQEALRLGHLPSDWGEEALQARLLGLLKRLHFQPEIVAGPVKLTASLREDDTFRRQVREHLAGQVSQLVAEVRAFVSEIVGAITLHVTGCAAVVMVVDSTERLSAPASAEGDMQAAVRCLFIQHAESLLFADLHCIYLLPPWVPITDGGALRLDTITFPTVRVARRDGSDDTRGLDTLIRIVQRRMPEIHDLISEDDLRDLCRMCGGVQRVLFTLLREVAARARRATVVPVQRAIIDTAIDSVRQDYLAITIEAAPALRAIDATKGVDGLRESDLADLWRYFQALVILQVANGEKWFTIHPLMLTRLAAT